MCLYVFVGTILPNFEKNTIAGFLGNRLGVASLLPYRSSSFGTFLVSFRPALGRMFLQLHFSGAARDGFLSGQLSVGRCRVVHLHLLL